MNSNYTDKKYLQGLKCAELRKICKQEYIRGYSNKNKLQLVNMISKDAIKKQAIREREEKKWREQEQEQEQEKEADCSSSPASEDKNQSQEQETKQIDDSVDDICSKVSDKEAEKEEPDAPDNEIEKEEENDIEIEVNDAPEKCNEIDCYKFDNKTLNRCEISSQSIKQRCKKEKDAHDRIQREINYNFKKFKNECPNTAANESELAIKAVKQICIEESKRIADEKARKNDPRCEIIECVDDSAPCEKENQIKEQQKQKRKKRAYKKPAKIIVNKSKNNGHQKYTNESISRMINDSYKYHRERLYKASIETNVNQNNDNKKELLLADIKKKEQDSRKIKEIRDRQSALRRLNMKRRKIEDFNRRFNKKKICQTKFRTSCHT